MVELETIPGDLRAVAQLEEGTLQHWDELSRDQIADTSLRDRGFYVADFPLYTARRGKPVFALARHTKEHHHNLVLVHLFDKKNSSYDQLIHGDGNFRPNPDEAQAVLDAADTLKVELSGLRLSGDDSDYRFLSIRTEDGFIQNGRKYERPNELEQALLQRVGYTPDFLDMMNSKPHIIRETKVYLLNPDYVVAEAGELFVGRAGWRDDFSDLASSYADVRYVYNHYGVRGVRRGVAAGDAPKNEGISGAPVGAQEMELATFDKVRKYSARFVPDVAREQFEVGLRKLYKP